MRCAYCGETFGAGGVEPIEGDPPVLCSEQCEVDYELDFTGPLVQGPSDRARRFEDAHESVLDAHAGTFAKLAK